MVAVWNNQCRSVGATCNASTPNNQAAPAAFVRSYFFSNSPVKWRLTNVVFPEMMDVLVCIRVMITAVQ